MELKERRDKLQVRESKVDRLLDKKEIDLKDLLNQIDEEREERDHYETRRKKLTKELEEEIVLDLKDKGGHNEHYDVFVENRRDELADLIETSEARLDRLVEHVARDEKRVKELKKKDSKLEDRIDRIVKKITAIDTNSAGQLSKSFHVAEFHCRNGAKVPSGIIPYLKLLCTQHLQPLRDSGGVVTINSGYRTVAYNAAIGGASQSYHVYTIRMKAPAADHIQAGRSAPSVQQWHENSSNPFDGMGFYSGFTHGDDRGYRSRWYGAS